MKSKVSIITGAASGLGRQLAMDLARLGSNLVLSDRDWEGLGQTQALLETGKSGGILLCRADVTDPASCSALVDCTLADFGRIDSLILCAGISMWARFDEVVDLGVFRRLVEVNYLGAVHCIQPALPALRKSQGSIVAISSLQGDLGVPHHTGYSASKHALNGFLEALSYEMAGEVHILTVLPGWITGTNLRRNAFKSPETDSASSRKHSREAVTVEECSSAVIQAMRKKKHVLYVPPKLRYLTWIHAVWPALARRIISRAVQKQEG